MKPYRLQIKKAVKQEQDRLPGHIRQRVRRLIESLAGEPRPAEAKELRDLPGYYRLRLDRWRIIYEVDDEAQIVAILAIRRKAGPETYENLE